MKEGMVFNGSVGDMPGSGVGASGVVFESVVRFSGKPPDEQIEDLKRRRYRGCTIEGEELGQDSSGTWVLTLRVRNPRGGII